MKHKCTSCNKLKSTNDFYLRNRKCTKRAHRCKECQSRINKISYHKAKESSDLPVVSNECWEIVNSSWRVSV